MTTEYLQMYNLDLEKAEEPKIKLPTPAESQKKQENSIKTFTFALLTILNSLTVWIAKKLWKILNETGIANHLTCLLRICMQVKKQQLKLDMEQLSGSKLGKEYVKAVYCHPAYLTYMQSTSCKMLDWMKHKLESRLLGKISIT